MYQYFILIRQRAWNCIVFKQSSSYIFSPFITLLYNYAYNLPKLYFINKSVATYITTKNENIEKVHKFKYFIYRCCKNNEITTTWVGMQCSSDEGGGRFYSILVGKPEGKRPVGRPR